jgi:hypothetical protein
MQIIRRLVFFFILFGTLFLLVSPTPSSAQIGISITVGTPPPPLPVYVQPELPAAGYIWTPGYWAWDPDFADYYWVPGTWVLAPRPGFLWTPAWWGWSNGYYAFHDGYWGPHIGFYGGVVYGFGYDGRGYEGGRWSNGQFFYNRTVNNVTNVHITNVYSKTVIVNRTNVSYNGGSGGVAAQPTAAQLQAAHETHLAPTSVQAQHVRAASTNTQLRFSANHGRPSIAATAKPGVFDRTAGVTAAKTSHTQNAETETQHPAAAAPGSSSVHAEKHHQAANPGPTTHHVAKTDAAKQHPQADKTPKKDSHPAEKNQP